MNQTRKEVEAHINENREEFEKRLKKLDRRFIVDLADKTIR